MGSTILNLIILGVAIVAANAQDECNKPPNMMSWKKCCKIAEPNFDAYKEQCGQFMLPIGGHKNPCLIDCVVNATNSMPGNKLNVNNARTMLNTIFAGNKEFIAPFLQGLQKCEPVITQKIADLKAKGRTFDGKKFGLPNCDPIPLVYSMCATKNVFITCPKEAWTASDDCEKAKKFAIDCEGKGMSMKKSGFGGKRGKNFLANFY